MPRGDDQQEDQGSQNKGNGLQLGSQGEQGGVPPEWKFFDLQQFEGLNTLSPRQTIEDDEFAWLENLFPIGPGNLRSMYGKGPNVYTAPTGKTIVYHYFYVLTPNNSGIGTVVGVPYAFVCLSDGTAVQVNLNTNVAAPITTVANTFYNGGSLPQCCQWGNQFLQIVNNVTANGYFLWDGTALYQAGSLGPAVKITNVGVGYTSPPTLTFYGGSGSGATAAGLIAGGAVTAINLTNAGAGYKVTDSPVQVQVSGGGITAKTAILTATINATGGVTGITIVDGGAGYVSPPTITFLGGSGTGATATVTLTGGVITGSTVSAAGTGYAFAPSVQATGGSNPAATATVTLMPFGIGGTAIENYQQRAWITNGPRGTLSAPNDLANFATSAGGGTFLSTDGFLKSGYTALKQSNSYLYLLADSSINNVSNVQSTGSPSTTTFSNLNSDAQVGTPWRDSVVPYGLALTLANTSGLYLLYGGAAEKISEKLNGLFSTALLPLTGTGITTALATVFGIKILVNLMTVIDPFTGALTPKLVCYEADRKVFFVASQEVPLTYISTQEVNSALTAWGTDGTNLFKLFNQPSTTLVKKGLTKLFNGDGYMWLKQFLRLYAQIIDRSSQGASVSYQIDTDSTTSTAVNMSGGGNISFTNNVGAVLQFQNSVNANLMFTSTGNSILMMNVDSPYGYLMGLRFTSTSPDFIIAAMSVAYKNFTLLK